MARLTGLEPATPGVTGRYSNQLSYNRAMPFGYVHGLSTMCGRPIGPHNTLSRVRVTVVARLTGLEPATPGVTGRYSNQLSYNRPLHTPLPELSAGSRSAARGRQAV